jgi:ribosome-binding protein aMBF1 (putative translation factor)
MKMLHTKHVVEIQFYGPAVKRDKAVEAMKALGFHVTAETIPARELFSEYTDQELPGAILRGARYREGLTQKQLAEFTGIPQRHISEMEHGKRPIGKKNAKMLAKALNVAGYKVFL